MTSIGRMRSVVLDCPDTQVLAEFYRDLLGWEIIYAGYDEEDGWTVLSDGGPIRIGFQRAADYRPPRWPDPEHPQQFHLDLMVDDLDVAENQALELGARKADVQPSPDSFRVFLDPADHPFCLCVD
ncbi:MAG TPA: VOC family protein [Actinophytocola sp.]|jgi:catechol 2,3-dioxygenase-like lactoylglutathione lyase family enzyme|uniref:VOC family protein n=1 Tax=Actinophytocola sp. TaxID=1872138 RepID=UPI002E0C225F|nr:VOC family protein [Actinophytocola sp.]